MTQYILPKKIINNDLEYYNKLPTKKSLFLVWILVKFIFWWYVSSYYYTIIYFEHWKPLKIHWTHKSQIMIKYKILVFKKNKMKILA